MASPDWASLPHDAALHVFSHLGTARDLGACATVCSAYHRLITREPDLWRRVAATKYGAAVADFGFQQHYGKSWSALLQDDNRRGAWPTLHFNKPVYWRRNSNRRFYCCFVSQIKMDRVHNIALVYIDVRGESDLRPPNAGSSVNWRWRRPNGEENMSTSVGLWRAEVETPGHYKGILAFYPEKFEQDEGQRTFCYANQFHSTGDYEAIPFPSGREIRQSTEYTPAGVSPFAQDSDATERERWSKLVPSAVLERRPNLQGSHQRAFTPTWWATAAAQATDEAS